jgi:predicted Fe-Mo cluster-binding NifX family protein
MLAIPIDSADLKSKSSKLFGNVNMFAIYKEKEDSFSFIENSAAGNGIKTAKFLKDNGATQTVYSYMGDGPFKELDKSGVDVFYIGKEPLELSQIVESIKDETFTKVTAANASTYLDPGTATENCTCGCS